MFERPIQKKLEEVLWPRLAGPIALTLSAMSLSTPLAAWYFGVVSLVGVVTNLLVLPLVTLIFYGVGAVCALGGIAPMLGGLLGRLLAWPIRLVLVTARLLGRVPFGALYPCGVFHALALAGILCPADFLCPLPQGKAPVLCGCLRLCGGGLGFSGRLASQAGGFPACGAGCGPGPEPGPEAAGGRPWSSTAGAGPARAPRTGPRRIC